MKLLFTSVMLVCTIATSARAQVYEERGGVQVPVHYVFTPSSGSVYVQPVPVPVPVPVPLPVLTYRPIVVTTYPNVTQFTGELAAPTRDPYITSGLVVLGVRAGTLLFLGEGASASAPTYGFHLGLASNNFELAFRLDMAELPSSTSRLHIAQLSFNYRFADDAPVHPVLGFGVESMSLSFASNAQSAFAFSGRLGLEAAVAMSDGALAFGVDATIHEAIANDSLPRALTRALAIEAFVDYHF